LGKDTIMRVLLSFLWIALLVGFLFAQSAEDAVNLVEDEQGFGLRATALGNAYIGVADDYSAIYWNPAGLAQITIGQFSTSISNVKFQSDALFLGSNTSESQTNTKFQSIGLVIPFPVVRGSFVMALGYQRIKDFDNYVKYRGYNAGSNNLAFDIENDLDYFGLLPFDEQLQLGQTIASEGHFSQWSMALAMDMSPNFSAGLTISLYDGRSDYSLDYSQDDVNAYNSYDIFDQNNVKFAEFYYNYYDYQQRVKSEFSGYEFKLGGLFRIIPERLRAGAVIAFPMNLKVNEDWSFRDDLSYDVVMNGTTYEFNETLFDDSGVFDYIIKIPFKFSAGLSFNYSLLMVSAAVDYRDWSQLKYDIPDDRPREEYNDLLNQNKFFKEDFRAVTSYSLGAEINLLRSALALRGGFRFVPSAFKEAGSDYDKKYYSAGLGYKVDARTMIDVSYVRGSWNRDKFYAYDWDADPMQTSEKYQSDKLLVGARFFFK